MFQDDFADAARWLVEQRPGGWVTGGGGVLVIDDAGGCTVWFRPELTAPVIITYEATVLNRGGPHDRVSDLNCFWMATDPGMPDGSILAAAVQRSPLWAATAAAAATTTAVVAAVRLALVVAAPPAARLRRRVWG